MDRYGSGGLQGFQRCSKNSANSQSSALLSAHFNDAFVLQPSPTRGWAVALPMLGEDGLSRNVVEKDKGWGHAG